MHRHRPTMARLLGVVLAFALAAAACTNSTDGDQAQDDSPNTTATSGDEQPSGGLGSALDFTEPEPDPTPLPLDNAVRTGTLDNGLTYYLRSNQAPGTRLELRLAVNAGSALQDDPDAGLAHFVEHMMFNGTQNYPDNSLDPVLQRLGLEIGPDVNAYTSSDETVYELTVATDPASVTEAFDVLADWAMAATIDEQQVLDERGVVREERRVRVESGSGQSFLVFDDIYTKGSDYETFTPIGTTEGILATTAEDARRFYDRWYRPELMAVIVVGDLTLDQMEEEVASRFSDFTARSDTPDRPELQTVPLNQKVVEIYTHPEVTRPAISLDYWIPTWDTGTVGGERLSLMDDVLTRVIQNRLDEGIEGGEIRALEASVGPFAYNRHSRFLGFNFTGDDLVASTEDVLANLTSLGVNGVTTDELSRVTSEFHAGVDQYLASAETRQDNQFAATYVAHFLTGGDASAVQDWHGRFSTILDELTADDLTNHYRYLMSVSAPLVVGLGPSEAAVPTVDELDQAIVEGVRKGAGAVSAAQVEAIGQLMVAPEVTDDGELTKIPEVDGFQIRFENGATAIFIPSKIAEGSVDLLAQSSGGWSTLAPGEGALMGLVTDAVASSGVAGFNKVQVDRFLSGSVVSLSPYIDETEEGFFGNAATDDAELMFQLLHLQVTEPQVDDVAFRAAVQASRIAVDRAAIDPSSLSTIAMLDARYDSDPYQVLIPELTSIDGLSADDTLALYSSRLGKVDDLVVAVAGDMASNTAIDLFRTYIGTLPSGADDTFEDRWVDPPTSIVERKVSAGADSSGAGVDFLFSAVRPVDDRVELTIELVSNVLQARLFEAVREDLGATYGGSVFAAGTKVPEQLIETFVVVNGDPERLDLIEEVVLQEIRDLASNGPTEDEFKRALAISSSDYELVGNFQLMLMLLDTAGQDPLDPFTRGEAWQMLQTITRSEVTSMARDMFAEDHWIRVQRSE